MPDDQNATKDDLAALEQRLNARINDVEQRMTSMEERLLHAIEQNMETSRNMETSLLTAFHSYAKGNAARLVKI